MALNITEQDSTACAAKQYLAVQLFSTWLYNYTVTCCTIIQYLAVQLYSTWLYNFTVTCCTIIQYLTVQLYSTLLYNYTIPGCTIIPYLAVQLYTGYIIYPYSTWLKQELTSEISDQIIRGKEEGEKGGWGLFSMH